MNLSRAHSWEGDQDRGIRKPRVNLMVKAPRPAKDQRGRKLYTRSGSRLASSSPIQSL